MKMFLTLWMSCAFFSAQSMENLKEYNSLVPLDSKRETYLTYEFTETSEYSYSLVREFDNKCMVNVRWIIANWKPDWISANPISDPVAVIIGLECAHACYMHRIIGRIENKMREKFPHRTTEIIWDVNPRDNTDAKLFTQFLLKSSGFIGRGGIFSKTIPAQKPVS